MTIAEIKGSEFTYEYAYSITALLGLAKLFPRLLKKSNQLIQALYYMIPQGIMYEKKEALISWYTQNIGRFMEYLG